MSLEVILREDVESLGTRGQLVRVAPGYARNFLIPRRLAVAATEANKKIVEQERQAHVRKEAKLAGEAGDLAKLLANVKVEIKAKAGENDQLFGSVTAKDIAEALEAQSFQIDRKKVLLDEPIRQLGEHIVKLRLHREVSIEIPVTVSREEGAA
jgi:large subunit ribosomal protein L9